MLTGVGCNLIYNIHELYCGLGHNLAQEGDEPHQNHTFCLNHLPAYFFSFLFWPNTSRFLEVSGKRHLPWTVEDMKLAFGGYCISHCRKKIWI